jgi:hypothetical protein
MMDRTQLRLLATDGPFLITFSPPLTADRLAIVELIGSSTRSTRADFCEKFTLLATKWGVSFDSEGVCD